MTNMRVFIVLACAASLAAVGCSSSSSSAGTEGGVAVTEQDFSIAASPSSAPAGEVSFDITNNGPAAHEFLVVKSDEDPGSLTVKDGIVPEDSLDLIDEQEDIAPSTTATLTVDLEAGSYILMCNVNGHYQQGMHAGFTVT